MDGTAAQAVGPEDRCLLCSGPVGRRFVNVVLDHKVMPQTGVRSSETWKTKKSHVECAERAVTKRTMEKTTKESGVVEYVLKKQEAPEIPTLEQLQGQA